MKVFINRKKSKWVITVIFAILLIFLILLVGNMIYSQINHKVPAFFGYSVMNIISRSMEPDIPKNTFILIQRVDPELLKEGDIITFYSSDPTIKGLPNTHRIYDITIEDGQKLFVTKGDANAIPDLYDVKPEDIIGVYVKNIVSLGKLGAVFQNKAFIFILLVVPAAVLFVLEIINLTKTAKNIKKDDDAQEAVKEDEKIDPTGKSE
ncbi:MAG TPA: signal peptidase I [Clostridia bacterium]|jgi:signal peptidase|nr:signal peptidase I [Clostridia bacterium]HQM96210.1 signal peptidase I [Clostridia bacterium]HQO70100.1 signal peptidase I [Clostridia bacterium]